MNDGEGKKGGGGVCGEERKGKERKIEESR